MYYVSMLVMQNMKVGMLEDVNIPTNNRTCTQARIHIKFLFYQTFIHNKTWLQIILLSDRQNIYLKNYPGKLSDYQIFGKGIKLKDCKIIGVIVDKENVRKL